MKPNFALNITDTAISLLHRTSRGWLEVGSVGFDNPDLDEALGYLRASALGLSPHGITTKLILPPGQILYTEVDVNAPDKAAREAQIRAALEGRTPYGVDELVFDWWGTGPAVKVAVVARETLEEAEAFAEAHRFNPVSYVTTPAEGQFAGEPWFGMTRLAASLLPAGEKVTRDQDPVKVITREVPKAEEKPTAQPTDAAKAAEARPEAEATELARAKQEAAAAADLVEAKRAEAEADKIAAAAAQKTVEDEAIAAERAEKAAELAAKERAEAEAEAEAARKTEAAKAEMERRAQQLAQAEAKRLVDEAERAKAALDERERAKAAMLEAERKRAASTAAAEKAATEKAAADAFKGVTDPGIADSKEAPLPVPSFSSRRHEDGETPSKPAPAPQIPASSAEISAKAPAAPSVTSVAARGPIRALPETAKMASSMPPRAPTPSKALNKPAGDTQAKPLSPPSGVPSGTQQNPANAKTAAPAVAKPAPLAKNTPTGKTESEEMVTAARIPGTSAALSRFKSKVKIKVPPPATKAQAMASGKAADVSLSRFGAKAVPRRGKPRFLGLILTMVLLGLLAAIAAWSSIYLSRDDTAPATLQQADNATTTDETPAPKDLASSKADQVAAEQTPANDSVDPEAVADAEAAADAEAELPPVQDRTAAEPEPEMAAPDSASPVLANDATADPANAANAQAQAPGHGTQDEIFLATTDAAQPTFDAVALPRPQNQPDTAPTAVLPPPPYGTQYEFEPDGSIKATAKGVVMPGGFWLIAARPLVQPPARPAAISGPVVAPDTTAAATPPPDNTAAFDAAGASTAGLSRMEGTGPSFVFEQDATVQDRRPKLRPASPEPATAPAQTEDDAALTVDPAVQRLANLRPRLRPQAIVAAAEDARKAVEAASLAAAAAAQESAQQNGAFAVALSPRPAARPRDFSGAVEAAIAAATRETTRRVIAPEAVPEPEQAEEPEVRVSSAPRIPTRANVAKQATFKNAINLSKTNLIGVYGTDSKRYALIRSSSGRYTKVRVGDRVDGGTVAAITRDELRYRKGGKMLTLAMPKG